MKLLEWLFGSYCPTHGINFRSDFCPRCVRARIVRDEVIDTRGEWVKSEGSWPIRTGDSE